MEESKTRPQMCLQWNLGNDLIIDTIRRFSVEKHGYYVQIDPPLIDDETYRETVEVVTTEGNCGAPLKFLCVKRVVYLRVLGLPIWERIIHTFDAGMLDQSEGGGTVARDRAILFACPLVR